MRTTFTNQELVHIFNSQTQEFGKGSNLFFEGNKIYSYGHHWLLGEFVDNDTIILNNKSYSNSTNKHLNLLWKATSDKKQFFELDIDLDLAHNRIKHKLDKLPNARTKKGYYLRSIFSIWDYLNEYHEYNRKKKQLTKANYLIYSLPKYKELKRLIKDLNNNREQIEQQIKEQKQKEQQRQKQREQKELIKFFAYETNYVNSSNSYLRLSEDLKQIESTKGIKIDLNNAKRLYFSVKNNFNIIGNKIEHYTIKSIDKNNLIVGCHTIPIDNVHTIGKQIEQL